MTKVQKVQKCQVIFIGYLLLSIIHKKQIDKTYERNTNMRIEFSQPLSFTEESTFQREVSVV